MKKIFVYLLLGNLLFGFSPYEMDKYEKVMVEVNQLKNKVEEQNIMIEGLRSVNEGLSEQVGTLLNSKPPKPLDNSELIKQLAAMIDDINKKYVSRDDLVKVVENIQKTYEVTKTPKINKKITSLSIYNNAHKLYKSKNYKKASVEFEKLVERNYKPAESNFYVGESNYYMGKYDNAVHYYKKSIEIKSDMKFADKLLYHSAYSLEKTGQSDLAIPFYENIMANYSGKYADLAKGRLTKIR